MANLSYAVDSTQNLDSFLSQYEGIECQFPFHF